MNMNGPRRPVMPANVSAQAVVPVAMPASPVAQNRSDRLEVASVTASWTTEERLVYSTSKPWRACDVFVQPTKTFSTGPQSINHVTVRVYAITASGRALVAKGHFGNDPFGAIVSNPPSPARLTACARCQAERFEVTIQTPGTFSTAGRDALVISVAASDEANDPPPLVGALFFSGAGGGAPAPTFIQHEEYGTGIELFAVSALNLSTLGSADERYLLIGDQLQVRRRVRIGAGPGAFVELDNGDAPLVRFFRDMTLAVYANPEGTGGVQTDVAVSYVFR
jgi:hypothetical protein